MKRSEFLIQASISAMQGVLESKGGFIGDIIPKETAYLAVRLAKALKEELENENVFEE